MIYIDVCIYIYTYIYIYACSYICFDSSPYGSCHPQAPGPWPQAPSRPRSGPPCGGSWGRARPWRSEKPLRCQRHDGCFSELVVLYSTKYMRCVFIYIYMVCTYTYMYICMSVHLHDMRMGIYTYTHSWNELCMNEQMNEWMNE